MNILFCGENFEDAIDHFQALMPRHKLHVCDGTDEGIRRKLAKMDVLIPVISQIDESMISNSNLGLIQQFGVGLEGVDIAAASQKGIYVARVPSTESGNAESVAEHALMLTLMLSKKFPVSQQSLKNRLVGAPIGRALFGKTACIVGMGGIGEAVARRLQPFGMNISGVHEYPERGKPIGVDTLYGLNSIANAVSEGDYVLLCLNYKPSRHHLFDDRLLGRFKKGAFLINVARGGLIDHKALLQYLQDKRIAGAGLDVFEKEPVDINQPLFKQNVIATPHLGGVTEITYQNTAKILAENIERFARGEKPLYIVNNPHI